jgi:large subunit ribosomal protein L6
MSRVAKNPISIPKGVEITLSGSAIKVKGAKGNMSHDINPAVVVTQESEELRIAAREVDNSDALAGTTRALINNMVQGVSEGWEKKLQLVGVGYRAQVQGKALNLTLGFSHPVEFSVPDGITIETPSQTEIVVRGVDKQQVGQVAANIRAYRPPEPYKGKGVRYLGEHIIRKEAKKK